MLLTLGLSVQHCQRYWKSFHKSYSGQVSPLCYEIDRGLIKAFCELFPMKWRQTFNFFTARHSKTATEMTQCYIYFFDDKDGSDGQFFSDFFPGISKIYWLNEMSLTFTQKMRFPESSWTIRCCKGRKLLRDNSYVHIVYCLLDTNSRGESDDTRPNNADMRPHAWDNPSCKGQYWKSMKRMSYLHTCSHVFVWFQHCMVSNEYITKIFTLILCLLAIQSLERDFCNG